MRIRGAELEVITRVTPDLDLIGAYTYLDARVESGDNAGKRVETVPEHQASLWAKYRLTLLGLPGVTRRRRRALHRRVLGRHRHHPHA